MLGNLLKAIFLPKASRERIEARQRALRLERQAAAGPDGRGGAGREQLVKEAMTTYRKQHRDVYESLDEDTRRQIEADAAKAFGDMAEPKS